VCARDDYRETKESWERAQPVLPPVARHDYLALLAFFGTTGGQTVMGVFAGALFLSLSLSQTQNTCGSAAPQTRHGQDPSSFLLHILSVIFINALRTTISIHPFIIISPTSSFFHLFRSLFSFYYLYIYSLFLFIPN
jgi:hypothetical protein